MKSRNIVIALTLLILLAGCAAEVIAYHSTPKMSVKEAFFTLVDLNNKQAVAFRYPLEITENYITYTHAGEKHVRYYFKSIDKVTINNENGFIKVYLSGTDTSGYVYVAPHSKIEDNMKDAELYVDALESLIYTFKERHKDLTKSENAASFNAQRLQVLQILKDKGLITDTEYQQKRKQILDGI